MLDLQEAGLPTGVIAKRLGVGQRTIEHWLAQEHGHYAGPRKPRRSWLDWSTRYLRERWDAGERNGTVRMARSGGPKATRDRAAVCIGVWPNGASIHACVDCLL